MNITDTEFINITAERRDIYQKLKDDFDFLLSVVFDEEAKVVHRLRATRDLSDVAKTLLIFLRDEEKIEELEKEVKELVKLVRSRNQH